MMNLFVLIGALDVIASIAISAVLLRRGFRKVHRLEWLVLFSFLIPGLLLVSPAVLPPGPLLSGLTGILGAGVIIAVVLTVREVLRLQKR